MADNTNAPPANMPPPSTAGAPGFDNQSNGQGNSSHMPPPPLPPVIIPQNNNPIPTAISSPMSGNVMSPTSAGGFVRRAAPEPNKRALYVGGLDPRVTEEVLRQIFETTGHVQSVKIIPDKNVSGYQNFTCPISSNPRGTGGLLLPWLGSSAGLRPHFATLARACPILILPKTYVQQTTDNDCAVPV